MRFLDRIYMMYRIWGWDSRKERKERKVFWGRIVFGLDL